MNVSQSADVQTAWVMKQIFSGMMRKLLSCTKSIIRPRKQSVVYEDTGNSSPRKSNFPELVERRRHRTGDCRKQVGRGRPEEAISQINQKFLYS